MSYRFIAYVAALVLLVGGYMFYQGRQNPPSDSYTGTIAQSSTTPEFTITPESAPLPGGLAPEVVSAVPKPLLDRPYTFPPSMPESIRIDTKSRIDATIALLKKDPSDMGGWINLGLYRKLVGDYEGARLAWEYVTKVRPQNAAVVANLADLHALYLKDLSKAEGYYLKVIELDASFADSYLRAYDFYLNVIGDAARARSVIEQGIVALPGDQQLKRILAELNEK